MTLPTTLPEALTEIEGLRGKVRGLLRLLERQAGQGAAGAIDSSENATTARQSSAELGQNRIGQEAAHTGRTQEEEERLNQDTLLALMLNTDAACIKRVAPDGTLLYMNQVGLRMVGLNAEEVVGRSMLEIVRPEYRASYIDMHQAVLKGESRTLQYEIQCFDGTRRWMETYAVPFLNPITGHREQFSVAHDITGRKRMEETFRENEERLQSLVNHIPGAIYRCAADEHWTLMYLSDTVEQLTGYPAADFLNNRVRSYASVIHPDDRRGVQDGVHAGLARKEPFQMEYRILHRDGETRWVYEKGQGVFSSNGSLRFLDGVIVDITERTQTEEALRRSEARLNQAQRLAHLGSWELDLTTNRLEWSDEIYRIFELDREQFGASYEAFLSLVHPDDRAAVDRAYTQSLTTKTTYEITHRLRMPDGRVKHVQEWCETLYDAQGRPQRSFGTVQDVTEQMRLAEREAARRKQLQTLSELGLTLSGDPAEIFERVVRMIGDLFKVRMVCLSEIVGPELHFKAVYVNGQVSCNAGRCPLAVTPCATVERDKDLRLFDCVKERFPEAAFLADHNAVSYCGFPSIDAHGRVVAVTCLLDDKPREFSAEEQALLRVFGQRIAMELERARYLADQAWHAEERERAHAFTRQIIDTVPNFIFAKDRVGRFTLANHAIAEAYGTTVDNLLGKTDADFNPHQTEVAFFVKKDLEVMDSLQERFIPEEKITDATGQVRWLQTVKRPILDQQGQTTMVLGVATDITERKRLEAELAVHAEDLERVVSERTAQIAKLEAQRAQTERLAALGQLAAGVAHEINNPIAGIKNAFRLVKEAIPKTHRYYEFVGMIDREINRTVSIVRQMYEIYRSEPRKPEVLDLAVVIGDLVKLFEKNLSQRDLGLVTDLPTFLPRIRASRGDLLQVLINLVQNAIDSSPAHGSITLSIQERDGFLRIAITDKGSGVAPDVMPKIFDPFFTTKTEGAVKGMGLGLSVSHNLVRTMRGRIEIETRANRGSTFTVVLPLESIAALPNNHPSYFSGGVSP